MRAKEFESDAVLNHGDTNWSMVADTQMNISIGENSKILVPRPH